MRKRQMPLTAAEVAPIWTGAIGDSIANAVLRYFIASAEDREVKGLLKVALELTEEHQVLMTFPPPACSKRK